MFNNHGEINASSLKDAMQTIAKYASLLENNVPSNYALTSTSAVDESRYDDMINRAIYTQDGKMALGQAMANPIRRNLDYQGVGRRVLVIDPLPQGALPVYDRDIDVQAMVVSSNGVVNESRVFGDRFVVPELEIASFPTVRIAEARRRRFNALDRAVQKARQEIMAHEDANIFAALDAASSVENTVQDITDAGLLKRDLGELKVQVDRWDLVTSKFLMNINEFNDILNWGSGGGQGTTGGELDPVSQREVLSTGLYAKLWGADIIVSKMVPPAVVYAVADPEFVGVMPIRQDIEVMPADQTSRLSLGWVVSEIIGIGIANPRGVSKGYKSTTIGV